MNRKPSVSLLTVTLGRELYIKRQIESVVRCAGDWGFEHRIFCQNGWKPSNEFYGFLESLPPEYDVALMFWEDLLDIGHSLNRALPSMSGELIMKLDDDAKLCSSNFMAHVRQIAKLIPNSVFSPYPVGLVGNPGGVLSNDRHVQYGEDTDTYYTFRKVNHVGGFARITPQNIIREKTFTNVGHSEDGEFTVHCRAKGIPMYYLENDLVVEHQESTLGQHERYGDDYFKGRF